MNSPIKTRSQAKTQKPNTQSENNTRENDSLTYSTVQFNMESLNISTTLEHEETNQNETIRTNNENKISKSL